MVYPHFEALPTQADKSKCEVFFAGKFVPRQPAAPKQPPPVTPPATAQQSMDELRLYVNNYGQIDECSRMISPGQVVAMESKGKLYLMAMKPDSGFVQI